jgi:hypothetical protein
VRNNDRLMKNAILAAAVLLPLLSFVTRTAAIAKCRTTGRHETSIEAWCKAHLRPGEGRNVEPRKSGKLPLPRPQKRPRD